MVHLHSHREWSRLDGLGTCEQYAARAADMGQSALGISDHGTLAGTLHHIKACRENEIHAVCGVEAYFRPNRSLRGQEHRKTWHLTLFARNLEGFRNLVRMTSRAFVDNREGGGFYDKPCVDYELLELYSDGVTTSLGCCAGWLSDLIQRGYDDECIAYVKEMQRIFGGHVYGEIMPHDFEIQQLVNIATANIAVSCGMPLVAMVDAHFPYREWAPTHKVVTLMKTASSFKKQEKLAQKREREGEEHYEIHTPTSWLMNEQEVQEHFARFHDQLPKLIVDEAIKNTELFASECQPFILDRSNKLPAVEKLSSDPESDLWRWICDGMRNHGHESDSKYVERRDYEWEILKKKGVIPYIWIVADIVRWAKSQGIRVGAGRGSSAGSLINYEIGITGIDPIAYNLLFERFLNPDRRGLPDIDIDFDSDKRDIVKEYAANRYGKDHVCDLLAFQTFKPKALLDSVGRVYDLPYLEIEAVKKTIDIRPDDEETTLAQLRPINSTLNKFAEKYPEPWEHMLRLSDTFHNPSKHAAGVIITPWPVTEYVPVERDKHGKPVTGWSDSVRFPVISELGLIKIDFLGIEGLSKHEYACKLIKENYDEDIDLTNLPFLRNPYDVEDEVLDVFRNGQTLGIFQFGGKSITRMLKRVKPDSVLDVAAVNALYRPGPMSGGIHMRFAERKHIPPDEIDYFHPLARPIIEETYGIVAYQEQVMMLSQAFGGFSGAEADDLRKAMGKLYRLGTREAQRFMQGYRGKFDEGCAERQVSNEVRDQIWDFMLGFGGYAFNKPHACGYSVQACQDAYLKAHYPLAFYASFLTRESDSSVIKAAVREAKMMDINIEPPSINISNAGWTFDGDSLRLGLVAIEGIGDKAANEIVKNRPFASFDDFLDKCSSINCKPLIEAGCFDEIEDRMFLLTKVDRGVKEPTPRKDESAEHWQDRHAKWLENRYVPVWEFLKNQKKLKNKRNLDLSEHRNHHPSIEEMIERENEVLAVSVRTTAEMNRHAIEAMRDQIYSESEFAQMEDGDEVIVGGEITRVKRGTTKNGDPYADVDVSYEQNDYQLKFWNNSYNQYQHLLFDGNWIIVNGRKNVWNERKQVVVNMVANMDGFLEQLRGKRVAS